MGGLQGVTWDFGGELDQLSYPMHGKPSFCKVESSPDLPAGPVAFKDIDRCFRVARYHSLHAKRPLPNCLIETARLVVHDKDGINYGKPEDESPSDTAPPLIMGIQHKTLPIAAVQFHPESILTNPDIGVQMLANAFNLKY